MDGVGSQSAWERWGGRLPIAVAAVALLTLGAALAREAGRALTEPPARRIDARYAPVLRYLNDQEIGFVTDLDEVGDDYNYRFIEAQYAVAPRLLVKGTEPRLVLADLNDPGELPVLLERQDFVLVHRTAAGVAVLMRSSR